MAEPRSPYNHSRRTYPPIKQVKRTLQFTAKDRKLMLTARVGQGIFGDVFVVESPIYQLNGETITYAIRWEGASSVSSPSATVYRGRTDVTSTVMPSGSHSASGDVITLKPLTALTSGSRYAVVVSATVDSMTRVVKIMVLCPRLAEESGGDVWVDEYRVIQMPGENAAYSILWDGADTLSSPGAAVYKDKSVTDSAATYLSTGANSVSGNVQTLKNLSALVGGSRFIVVATCTADGNVRQVKILVVCPAAGGEQ